MPRDYGSTGAQQFASAPAAGPAGSTYFNTTLSRLFVSDGASWSLIGYDLSSMPQAWTKESVLCATTANITLSGSVSVDGIGPSAGQRVLVKDQTLPAENGIYVAAAGAWTRALDAQLPSQLAAAAVGVDNGTVNAGTVWYTNFNTSSVLGTTAMTWTKLGASGGGAPTGAAGGDLTGTYPNPTIGTGKVTSPQIATAGVRYANMNLDTMDLAAAQPSMRSLGSGLYQAAPGGHSHNVSSIFPNLNASPNYSVVLYNDNLGWFDEKLSEGYMAGWIAPVRACTPTGVGNVTLSGLQTLDGVVLAANDRVLLRDQTTASQNGIYVVASGAWSRAIDADSPAELAQFTKVRCTEGVQNKESVWTQMHVINTVSTDAQEWKVYTKVQVGGLFNFPSPRGVGQLYYNLNQRGMSVWDGTKWAYISATVWTATSSTRPAATYCEDGLMLYETDTKNSYISVSNAWVPMTEVAVQAAQPTDALDLWVDTDEFGTPIAGAPTGAVSYQEIRTTFGTTSASTTVVDVGSLAVTVNATGVRRYKITVHVNFTTSVAADRASLVIREGTTQIQGGNFILSAATTLAFEMTAVVVPTSGTHTYTVGFYRGSGTGTLSLLGTATAPAFILIEDIGV